MKSGTYRFTSPDAEPPSWRLDIQDVPETSNPVIRLPDQELTLRSLAQLVEVLRDRALPGIPEDAWAQFLGGPARLILLTELPGFFGDLNWLHRQEGHAGKPYWPGGVSGVTLDPGFDLGRNDMSSVNRHYGAYLTEAQLGALAKVASRGNFSGKRGEDALKALDDEVLRSIRISAEAAEDMLADLALPYWLRILERFPSLLTAPGYVQTALLSLAYNRGANNGRLNVLREPIADRQWGKVAERIAEMQQNHALRGIRKRRRAEAGLILTGLRNAEKERFDDQTSNDSVSRG